MSESTHQLKKGDTGIWRKNAYEVVIADHEVAVIAPLKQVVEAGTTWISMDCTKARFLTNRPEHAGIRERVFKHVKREELFA